MAKMTPNPLINGLSGAVGEMVHRTLWGTHVISHKPDFSDRVPSPKQIAQNNQYKDAGFIWDSLAPEVKVAYRDWGKRLNKPPYALFNKNHSRPPSVEKIDLSQYTGQAGQTIAITATDLFQVARVEVTVRDAAGTVAEKGAAAKVAGTQHQWTYSTTVSAQNPVGLSVEAVAVNWPAKEGNRIELLSAHSAG
jgi:hypothetical protein